MIDMTVIGGNIRKERKRQLLTIEQLAEKAGITENFLGKIERGEGMPSLPTIDSIACALKVSIDLLKGAPEAPIDPRLLQTLMELNGLTPEKREQFLDFLSSNIKYFK